MGPGGFKDFPKIPNSHSRRRETGIRYSLHTIRRRKVSGRLAFPRSDGFDAGP